MATAPNPIATGWLNENALREYPFHEGCGLRPNDSSGAMVPIGWTLPNCLLVDMTLSVEASNIDYYLYLGRMSVVGQSVTLVFFDRSGNAVISAYVSNSSHEIYNSYPISGTGSFLGAQGTICVGDLNDFFDHTPEGVYEFSPEEAQIEPSCIHPSASGVRSLQVVDASGYAMQRLTGDVKLVAGANIRLDYAPDENAILISADPNAGYSEACDCENKNAGFVRSINGISVADVTIVGDECVHVDNNLGDGIITISDECAKPCCGCAETVFINQTINDLQTSVGTLEGNVASLGDRLVTFINSYVLSRKTLR